MQNSFVCITGKFLKNLEYLGPDPRWTERMFNNKRMYNLYDNIVSLHINFYQEATKEEGGNHK